ncbi:TlpA family protein disulfide reductase [Patescibacteria group bacterium]|nr:TlpA family protein disulfide reductase [Patescibacteria group bacterium]MBU1673887.1 TlpA family protein disulfide reductase [Patescibacteria group bacterium]MBU1963440.1 TlpA family protein disulfide reductase [Patescibacteria group bacterium]
MENTKSFTIIGLIILIIIGLGISAFYIFREQPKIQEIDYQTQSLLDGLDQVPDFELKDFNGNVHKREDFQGQYVIINSWASWCPFCTDELPDFTRVKEEMGDKITIIAINRNESDGVAKEYKEKLDMNGELLFLQDPGDTFYQSIGGFSMPETLFINKEGYIVEHYRGPLTYDEIKEKIENLINE